MGLSSSKKTSKETTKQTTSGTTTPTNPEWVNSSIKGYVDKINAFGQKDPNSLVAPASDLQQQAWGGAKNLGGWKTGLDGASAMASKAGNAPANLAGEASTAAAQGYTAPKLGAANTYNAASAGAAQQAAAEGYSAQTAQSQSGADYMARYQNPYEQQVVNTTLADMDDNAGRVRAAQAADAARNGAFGGSRYGIREAATEDDLARARASASAQLRSQGFNTAAGLGMADADRSTQTSMFNAGQTNQASQFGANARNQASLFNAGEQNRFALDQAGRTDAASQFGANANNQFALSQAGLDADAAQFGAAAGNQASMFNAGARNDMARFNAGQQDDALARQLQAAGLMGDFANSGAANQRADLGLMSDMGEDQRGIEQARRTAELSQLQAMGELYGGVPFDLFNGQTATGTMSGTGTTTQKSSPSLFSQALSLASLFTPAGYKGGA